MIMLTHFVISSWYAHNTPLFSDGTLHSLIINEIVNTGYLPTHVPNLYNNFCIPYFIQPNVHYPPLYYIIGVMFHFLFGEKAVYWIAVIFTTLTIPFGYLIGKKMFNKRIGLFFALIIGISQGLMVSVGSQKIIIPFFAFAILFVYLNYLEKPTNLRLGLLALLIASSFGILQSMYFYALAILFHFLIYRCLRTLNKEGLVRTLKPIFTLSILTIILFTPIISYQISTTGTIDSPKITKWPVIDEYIFHPNYLDLSEWQVEINEKVDIEEMNKLGGRMYQKVHLHPLILLANDPSSFIDRYFNPYAQSFIPKSQVFVPLHDFLLLMLVLGIFIFIRKIDIQKTVFIFIAFFGFIVLLLTARINLYWMLPFLSAIFFALALNFIRKVMPRHIFILFISVLIISSIIGSVLYVQQSADFAKKTYSRTGIPGGFCTLLEVSEWLNQHTSPEDKIMAAHTYELPYYSNRTIFWDYRLFFLPKEEVVFYLENYHKPKYVVILDHQIVDDWDYFLKIPSKSSFIELLKNETIFKEVYYKNTVHIYKFHRSSVK